MVNKVTSFDSRVSTPTQCGTTLAGQYFRKAQSGGDSPSLPRRERGVPKRRFSSGLANEHAYTMSVNRLVDFPIKWRFRNDPPGTYKTGTMGACGFAPESVSITFDSNDDYELISKLYSKVAGSSFNLAVTLAQSGQSLDLITGGATRIYTALRALRRGDIPKLASTLGVPVHPRYKGKVGRGSDDLTKTWLEYQYGWRPLLTDIHDAAQLLATRFSIPQTKEYVARKQKSGSLSVSSSGTLGYSSASTSTIRKQIIYRVQEGGEISSASLSGFLDPQLVAWELMPYSFVVDWIYPVGAYLEARSQLSKLQGTFITTTTEFSRSGGNVYPLGSSAIGEIVQSVEYSSSSLSLNRVLSAPTVRPPKLVPLGEALSWRRAVSALSLLNNFT